jgi:hypothetical protein
MELFGKPVGKLDSSDLQRLVDESVAESDRLDFKREWPQKGKPGRSPVSPLVDDIVAMANTRGGVLLIGIDEKSGPAEDGDAAIAGELVGCGESFDLDASIRQLTSALSAHTDAPLHTAIEYSYVRLPAGGGVVAIGVPMSPQRPHLQTESHRLLRRAARQNYDPGILELRAMFDEGRSWRRRAEEWQAERPFEHYCNQQLHGGGGPRVFIGLKPADPYANRLNFRAMQARLYNEWVPFADNATGVQLADFTTVEFIAHGVRRRGGRGTTKAGSVTNRWWCELSTDGTLREWRVVGFNAEWMSQANMPGSDLHVEPALVGWGLVAHIQKRVQFLREVLGVREPLILTLAWYDLNNAPLLAFSRSGRVEIGSVPGGWLVALPELLESQETTDLPAIRRAVETLWTAAGLAGIEPSAIGPHLSTCSMPFDEKSWEWTKES